MKKLNKKGFTLAELLIVVAIIAVLTAIAVPLFVGALNKAETNVKEANIRAVRGYAVEEILMNQENTNYQTTDGKLASKFYVYATVSKSGQVTSLQVRTDKTKLSNDTASATKTYDAKGSGTEKTNDGYSVRLEITDLTVS